MMLGVGSAPASAAESVSLFANRDDGAVVVGKGYYIALSREHAKRVFGQKDDDSLRSLLQELLAAPAMKKEGRLLDVGRSWNAIHRCLTDGELDPAGGDFPLNHTVLGGKSLHQGDDYAAILIRPDIVAFVSEALNEVEELGFREKFFALNPSSYELPINDKAFVEVWLAVRDLKLFFDAAAESLEAVLFTAKYKE